MLTKRDKLLIRPWILQRFHQHRRKVQSAAPRIDFQTPSSHPHVSTKLKKAQKEQERQTQIENENIRLLQRLGAIMKRKSVENLWNQPRPNFLNREVMYNVRPKTSLPKEVCPETPVYPNHRCPACNGKPYKRNQVIPEERVPFPPVKKSINRKLMDQPNKVHICCRYCC